jgi:UDP-N-acetylmuramate--alanine ligase
MGTQHANPTDDPTEAPVTEPTLDTLRTRRVHLVGAGGSGMSGLGMMLHAQGAPVTGSDQSDGTGLAPLHAAGIPIALGPSNGGIPEDRDLLIHSAAVQADHPELLEAQRRGLEVLSYAEALGRAQAERTGISIAGTHGKSTTTALLSHVLMQCDLDPSVIVGAHCPQLGGGWRVGSEAVPGDGPFAGRQGLMVCEACEFNRSFHHHRPVLGLINNIEEDHLDVYAGIEEIIESFRQFAQLLPNEDDGGFLLIAHDGAHRREVTSGLECAVETFGYTPEADWHLTLDQDTVHLQGPEGTPPRSWTTPMPGAHNASNAAAAAIIAHRAGAEWPAIIDAIEGFAGLDRRLQRLGGRSLVGGGHVEVLDDYGHHPSEVEVTLRAIRGRWDPKRLICVFQPHQHSRTRFLLDQFATSFTLADIVIVPHIHFVRDSEAERNRVSAGDLVDRLRARGTTAMHMHPFEAIVEQLEVICRDGDLIVVMGAGSVWEIGRAFIDAERSEGDES